MRDKKKETMIYKGLGFPIKLIDVPMKKMFGDWVMDIDMTALQEFVLRMVIHKATRLTKTELKFIRHFLVLTTAEFGKIFGVTPSTVDHWENGRRKLSLAIEVLIRLYVMNHLQIKDEEFRNLYNQISLEKLSRNSEEPLLPIEIDASGALKIFS